MNKPTVTIAAITMALTAAACGSQTADNPVAAPPSLSSTASPDPTTTIEAVNRASSNGTPITITAGNQRFTATLNDTAVARDFAATLPITLPWFRNAGIEYITELPAPMTETGPFYTDVEAGDIVYYNPLDSITIIYAPTSSVPTLTKMGEVTSDLNGFKNLPENVDMRIERRT